MHGIEDAPREVAKSIATPNATPNFQSNQTSAGTNMMKKTHPMIIVAAGAVTLFCGVGIAVLTGVIPSAHSLNGAQNSTQSAANTNTGFPPALTSAGASQAAIGSAGNAVETAPAPQSQSQSQSELKPVDRSTIGQPLAKNESHTTTKTPVTHSRAATQSSPVPTYQTNAPGSTTERGVNVASNTGYLPTDNSASNVVTPVAPPVICRNCGVIDGVIPVTEQGQGSGAGAVLGGLLGGVLGHQVGKGKGRDVATVAGAVGGAVLGNSVEKSNKTTQHVNIRVRLDDGTFQTIKSDTDQGMRIGDKVRIENGRLVRN